VKKCAMERWVETYDVMSRQVKQERNDYQNEYIQCGRKKICQILA